jgi:hypothetical protein
MLLEPICVWLVCVVSVCGRLHLSHCNLMNYEVWRRDRDSNPGSACTDNGFRDRRIRPLCHLSAVVVAWVLAKPPPGGKGQKHCNLIGGNPRCKLQNHLYRTRVSVALVR